MEINCLEQIAYKLEMTTLRTDNRAAGNSTYPKGGVSYSKDSFVVNQTLDFQIMFCGKSPALRVAAKHYRQPYDDSASFKPLSKKQRTDRIKTYL